MRHLDSYNSVDKFIAKRLLSRTILCISNRSFSDKALAYAIFDYFFEDAATSKPNLGLTH